MQIVAVNWWLHLEGLRMFPFYFFVGADLELLWPFVSWTINTGNHFLFWATLEALVGGAFSIWLSLSMKCGFFFFFLPSQVALVKLHEGHWELPCSSGGKESACNAGDSVRSLGWEEPPWSQKWQPTSVFLPGESHGQRSLSGYSPWSLKESDTTEVT